MVGSVPVDLFENRMAAVSASVGVGAGFEERISNRTETKMALKSLFTSAMQCRCNIVFRLFFIFVCLIKCFVLCVL